MLCHLLQNYITNHASDKEVIELFQRVKTLQSNGIQISKAIERACDISHQVVHVGTKHLHADNTPARLAIRHRSTLRKLRSEGYGYGKIAKHLAQRGTYNKTTGKAYSRATLQRACYLIEK